jgi:N-acetylglucosaminyl-diphospho-decaprenol L-rhamnosyltransferase
MEPEQPESLPLLVCALIVSHNCADALRRSVAALEASKGRERMEILVVDNGSRDGSQRMDSEFPDINMLRLPHFCGLTKARNIGIRTAKAEYLLLLEPGVEVEPGTVMALVDRLEGDPTALAVCPYVKDDAGAVVSKMYELPSAAHVSTYWENPLAMAQVGDRGTFQLHDGKAILLRRHTIQGMNYLDQKFGENWGDVEMAFQIHRAGKKMVMAPDIEVRRDGAVKLWAPTDSGERAAFAADAANGAAVYLGKHFGFAAGLGLRLKVIFGALLKTITFQDFGFNSSLLSRAISGYKIDGSSQRL